MSCPNCENEWGRTRDYNELKEPFEYQLGMAVVGIIACDEHLKQIIEILDKSQ